MIGRTWLYIQNANKAFGSVVISVLVQNIISGLPDLQYGPSTKTEFWVEVGTVVLLFYSMGKKDPRKNYDMA